VTPDAPVNALALTLMRLEQKLDRLLMQTAPKRPGDDGKVFKDPKEKYWQGESYVGSRFSECPADYLRAMAKYKAACAWANRKEGDPTKAQYAEKDDASARLANLWADYQEATMVDAPPRQRTQKASADEFGNAPGDDGEIPF
jgi:hypothetical protein